MSKVKFTKDGESHTGEIVHKRFSGRKLVLTVRLDGGDVDIDGADALKSCEGCEFFERKADGDYFGTCEYTHNATEGDAVCRYHSFAWGKNQ